MHLKDKNPILMLLALLVTTHCAAQTQPVHATIDASKTSAPISKYIYGQFLEHIGGIVNNNIWAEMLDDRKFYFPINSHPPAEPSGPARRRTALRHWMPIGADEFVTMDMDKDRLYVGEHTPLIKLSSSEEHGIQQAGLAVRKGKSYRGRLALAGTPGTIVKVSLIWGNAASDRQTVVINKVGSGYRKFPLTFQTQGDSDDARIEIVGLGIGFFYVGAVSLMPADNLQGFRAEVVAALKQLHSGIYRWPGGNFVSGHEWRDAIGDPDKRPPIMDPVWHAVQPNDVGTDEFMTLCRLLDVEPYVTVNGGFGDEWSAAQLVEYTNGAATTPMGKLRAAEWSSGAVPHQTLGRWKRTLGRVATRFHARLTVGTQTQHVRDGDAKSRSHDQANCRRCHAGRHDRLQAGEAPERPNRPGLPLSGRLEWQPARPLSRQYGYAQRAFLFHQRKANRPSDG